MVQPIIEKETVGRAMTQRTSSLVKGNGIDNTREKKPTIACMTWFPTPGGFEVHCIFGLFSGCQGGTRNSICHHLEAYLSSRGIFLTSFENLAALLLWNQISKQQNKSIRACSWSCNLQSLSAQRTFFFFFALVCVVLLPIELRHILEYFVEKI